MNRRQAFQYLLALATAGLCGCMTKMQSALASFDFDGVNWKQFESRMLGKIIRFDFPIDVPGTSSFSFNPSYSPPKLNANPDSAIVALRTDENIGWVHATSGVNIFIFLARQRRPEDKFYTLFYEFPSNQDLFKVITEIQRDNALKSCTHSLVKLGNYEWVKSICFWKNDASHDADSYSTILNKDYYISVVISLGTRGKPDETRLNDLRKIGERIVRSVRIDDDPVHRNQ